MLKRIGRPSPGAIIAVVALILAMAGGAYAASKIGPKRIKPNAIRTSKIRDGAVTTDKLADGAVTNPKIAANAVGSSQIADSAVTSAKLDPGERSEAFTRSQPTSTPLPAATDTTIAQMTLPAGNFVVTAQAALGSQAATQRLITCDLLDANNPIASGNEATEALTVFSDTISLTGISDGGVVKLSCNPDGGAQAKNMQINAIRVGTVTTLTQ